MASKEIKTGRLYGVIAPILPDGRFVKCEPVFVDFWNLKDPSDYYIGVKFDSDKHLSKKSGISHFEKIDISTYGKKVFLPASRNKINDGKKYFIAFQPTKNYTRGEFKNYYDFPSVSATTQDRYYSYVVNVGILFPNKFVTLIANRELSEEYLQSAIQ